MLRYPLKAYRFAPSRAPTTQGAQSAASWKERMMEIYSGEDARKKPAQWAHENYFEPTPLQDTKVQRKYQKRKQNSGNFYRKIALRLLWRNRHILRRHVRPLRRAHTAASWAENVVNIRFYYPHIFAVTRPVTQAIRCNKTQKLLPYICNHKPQSFRINVTQYTFLI